MADLHVRVPDDIDVLPAGYRDLLERAVEVLAADERVRAVWLSGSLARGDADVASDLDLLVAVADAEHEAFAASWREWLAAITPTVLARPLPFLAGSFYSLTPDCLRLDVVVEPVSMVANSFFHARRVVFDRDGLDASVPDAPPAAGPDRAKVETAIEEPLRYLALLPSVLARGEVMLSQEGLGHMRRRVSELFLEANAPLPTTGVKHWRDKLTDEQYAVLESIPWPAATHDAVTDASLAAGRALIEHGRPIAERLGIEWPQALEDAVRAYLQRELGVTL
jgi:hypothetical protein